MTRSFVLTNHKGGVGKSTSATNIALGMVHVLRHLNAGNCRVLLVDTDSQGHATLVTTGRNDFSTDNSLYTVLMADRKDASHVLAECIVESTWRVHGMMIFTSCPPLPCWKVQSANSPELLVHPTVSLIHWQRSHPTTLPSSSTPVRRSHC